MAMNPPNPALLSASPIKRHNNVMHMFEHSTYVRWELGLQAEAKVAKPQLAQCSHALCVQQSYIGWGKGSRAVKKPTSEGWLLPSSTQKSSTLMVKASEWFVIIKSNCWKPFSFGVYTDTWESPQVQNCHRPITTTINCTRSLWALRSAHMLLTAPITKYCKCIGKYLVIGVKERNGHFSYWKLNSFIHMLIYHDQSCTKQSQDILRRANSLLN